MIHVVTVSSMLLLLLYVITFHLLERKPWNIRKVLKENYGGCFLCYLYTDRICGTLYSRRTNSADCQDHSKIEASYWSFLIQYTIQGVISKKVLHASVISLVNHYVDEK